MTVVEVRNASKRFRNTRALDGVSLFLRSGEILGIAGPNGAGKSTLARVLSGEEVLDSGEIQIDGHSMTTLQISEVVAVVHQEPQVWLNLTIAENLMVGNENSKIVPPDLTPEQVQVLKRIGLSEISGKMLLECSLAVRQRVEIARALVRDAKVFLFDEPNSALTDEESKSLFQFMHELAEEGKIVALVTHRLSELVSHCDRVVVIRDGRIAKELEGSSLTEIAIASELVASAKSETKQLKELNLHAKESKAIVATKNWSDAQGAFLPLDLTVVAGEIVVIVGVEGSGGREIVSTLGGMRRSIGEAIVSDSSEILDQHSKVAYLSANRREMLYHNLSVGENLVSRLGTPTIANGFGWLKGVNILEVATQLISRYKVRTEGASQSLTSLSGGNQQKVAIAGAMACNPSLLLVEEPTRGVDVGSKREIYQMLREYANRGRSIVAFCTEAPEAYELGDRVLVISRGECRKSIRPENFPDVYSFAHSLADSE